MCVCLFVSLSALSDRDGPSVTYTVSDTSNTNQRGDATGTEEKDEMLQRRNRGQGRVGGGSRELCTRPLLHNIYTRPSGSLSFALHFASVNAAGGQVFGVKQARSQIEAQ